MLVNTLLSTLVLLLPNAATASVTDLQWKALNLTVGGRLHAVVPYARSCYGTYVNDFGTYTGTDEALCEERLDNTANYQGYRKDVYSSYVYDIAQSCKATDQGCNWSGTNDTSLYTSLTCYQGNLPDFYIDLQTSTAISDIRAAYAFSKLTGIPISIKNTGHDTWARSAGHGSLSLWTHHLQNLDYTAAFIPSAAPAGTTPVGAITIGAGVNFDAAFTFAKQNSVTFVGGSCDSVGASGGWFMGGGLSPLSGSMGMGVDRVIQFNIVTPDGIVRTANKYKNPELFWAVRGGGPATYGVVLSSTHLVDPVVSLSVIEVFVNVAVPGLQRQIYDIIINNTLSWSDQAWGGYLFSAGLIYANPRLNATAAAASMAPIIEWANSLPSGSIITGPAGIRTFSSYYDFQYGLLKPIADAGIKGTSGTAVAGRLIQERNFATAESRAALLDAFMTYLDNVPDKGQPLSSDYVVHVAGPRLFHKEHPDAWGTTSLHPAWHTAIMHAESQRPFAWNADLATVEATYAAAHESIKVFKAITPDTTDEQGGSYMNESDMYATDFKKEYFGSNYDRLVSLKQKYDPFKVLKPCWQCVGWEGPNNDLYKCQPPNTGTN